MKRTVLAILCMGIFGGCVQPRSDAQDQTTLIESNPTQIKMRVKKAMTVETKNAGQVAFFTVLTTRVPPRKKFILQNGDLFDPDSALVRLQSDDSGRLWAVGDEVMGLHKVVLPMFNLLPGEPSSFWLVSQDRKIQLRTSFVAYPLEAAGMDGAEIAITRLNRNGSLVHCEGSYFRKNEQLQLILSSKDQQVKKEIICLDGRFTTLLAPPDSKSYGHHVKLEIVRSDGEILSLSYPWGRTSFDKACFMAPIEKLQIEDRKQLDDALEVYYFPYSEKAIHLS